MPASRTSELARQIVALCNSPDGRSTQEIADILGKNRNSISVYMSDLTRAGTLFKGGADKSFRFFTDPKACSEYQKQASIELARRKEATNQRRRELAAEKGRNKRANARKEKGLERYQRPERVNLAPRDSGLIIATTQQQIDHKRLHQQANVIWPEGVKVTIIPTGVDTRFMAFVEPGKGQISRDWMANRKLSART